MNHAQASYLPWSHQFNALVRALICLAAGVGVGVIGTFAHRMGAARDIPYGLVLALAIVSISTWCARSRSGATGLALHLIASSAAAWLIALGYPHGDALTPSGFGGAVPYFSQHVGYLWLFGMILVQVALLLLPARLLRMPERRVDDDSMADNADAMDHAGVGNGESRDHMASHKASAEEDALQ
ncbi:MAG: alcohol dehydrogenase [Bifidobacterium sp.]|nr:alcohol dehydrogenase [Bifidobacterium sp.]